MTETLPLAPEELDARIVNVRGLRVLFDFDLAALYGVSTKRFNEAVRRNAARFPEDFSFVITDHEVTNLRSQIATSSFARGAHGGRRYLPRVFTEHGAIMAAMLLNSERAIQMSVHVVRAFVRFRKTLASTTALNHRLEALEQSVTALDADTRKQFDQVYEAILGLMRPANPRQ